MDELLKSQLSTREIQVSIPASVAYDLKKFQKITETVLGRLGCPACCSGFDIRFIVENRFRFNDKLELLEGGILR
ncbi:MAG: hypothetical protein KFF73_04585 [Cyclobacteriaceae bacterium]|nr:hypothetical protein [Cyclobacteriaceae bacterium]